MRFLLDNFKDESPKSLNDEKIIKDIGRYAMGFSSGTAALHAASFAIGLTSSDEVIVPANTFIATATAPTTGRKVEVVATLEVTSVRNMIKAATQRVSTKGCTELNTVSPSPIH